MKIIGVGCGPGLLTVQAIQIIQHADLIYGSDRAIELVQEYIPKTCTIKRITDYTALRSLPEHAIVLSTGDPMVSGLGYLDGEVITGISSIQYAAAQLHIPLTKTGIISAHGRAHKDAIQASREELQRGKNVCIITDPQFVITELAEHLIAEFRNTQIILCEDLGYPSERIVRGDCVNPPFPQSEMYILFLLTD